ncbi:Zn(II)2Cys6 transcription factor [Aspergillus arachidicola]|uniref:Zn(II)2Cys6 transcription factor n=1 Tax=Aspergillus arachidicola TaxID=656916 RepID=A0A2G7FSM0_9EURO|nr:Zn(II)2Cys6 transcription factor [Aspergillus arachidicola]
MDRLSERSIPNVAIDDMQDHSPKKEDVWEEVTHDAVFGEISDEGPNYRNVGFFGTVILMMKTQIGLGVLSIPTAFDTLGMIPGVIVLCAVAAITTWSAYVVGTFKLRHREIYGIDDAGALILGPVGRVILATAFCLWISIGLNAVSTHALCTAVFVVIAAIPGFLFSSIRTLGKITWLAWVGLPCILTAILIVTIAVGIQDRPAAAPPGEWVSDFKVVGNPGFTKGITAVSAIVFAFSGTPGFFSIVSEMREPRQFTKAVMACQAGVTIIYIIIGVVVYYYCGSYVSSPALGSAGGTVKKISYGFALPGLIVTLTIVSHIPAKYIFLHLLRGSKHLTSNSPTHWICWLSCTFSIAVIAYIIASVIPVFDSLVSLIGALLGPLMCFQTMGGMWLYDNWGTTARTKKCYFMAGFNKVKSGPNLGTSGQPRRQSVGMKCPPFGLLAPLPHPQKLSLHTTPRNSIACIMVAESKPESRKVRRTANAAPQLCFRRKVRCVFTEPPNKVVVTESYLQQLRREAYEKSHSQGTKRSSETAFTPDVEPEGSEEPAIHSPPRIDHARSIWTSPFTLPSKTIKNTHRNKRSWIWLAPSSMWSFTARLTLMMTEKLNLESHSAPNLIDRDIYLLHWRPAAPDDQPDIHGLPSLDHALYLLNTVMFYMGQNYFLFEKKTFLAHLHEFYYGDALQKAMEYKLWFVQYLLVLAFGSAFVQLGQAIRIAQLEGMHTQLPEEELGIDTVTRCHNLWWTLYLMDRHFSASLGLPMITQDNDITTLIDPPTASSRNATLSLRVRLSQMLSFILSSIYKTEETQLGIFLEQTRSVLHTMAGLAQEIESAVSIQLQKPLHRVPRETRLIMLIYHQCVIVATRPLLLSVLKERLEKLGHGEEDWQSLLVATEALIATGIKSAAKTLQLLTDEDDLLEAFLPFDLEYTYGAAIHLMMAHTLFPGAVEDCSLNQVYSILDGMIYKGNQVAAARKAELTHLEYLFQELATRIERRGLQTLTLHSLPQDEHGVENPLHQLDNHLLPVPEPTLPMDGDSELLTSDLRPTASNMECLDSLGISSYEFFSIVAQIGHHESYSLLDPRES